MFPCDNNFSNLSVTIWLKINKERREMWVFDYFAKNLVLGSNHARDVLRTTLPKIKLGMKLKWILTGESEDVKFSALGFCLWTPEHLLVISN